MPAPRTGTFKIVSLVEDSPAAGVALYVPTFRTVRLNEAIQVWKLTQYWAGPQIYWFAIDGYPYTGVLEEKVTATVYAEQDLRWRIIYREAHDAHTIEPDNGQGKGWTVSPGLPNPAIVVTPLVPIRSIPLQSHLLNCLGLSNSRLENEHENVAIGGVKFP